MTNKVIKLPDINKMKEEGSLWLAKLDRGLSHEEEILLKKWLERSPDNKAYFVALAKQWDQLSVLSQLAETIPYETKKNKSNISFYAKAATIAFVFILGSLFLNTTGNIIFSHDNTVAKSFFTHDYTTTIGEKSTIHLPDSSILTLNTNSLVKVNFTPEKRELTLLKGELHIDVAHNKERRLVLLAGNKYFVAVGTAFNVRYDEKSLLELIVTDGKVGITDAENTDEVETLFTQSNKNNPRLVNAGERVTIPPQNTLTDTDLTKENIKQTITDSLAWRDGRLIFKGETLEKVIHEMSRYSNVDFELEGEELKKIKIGGRFKTGDISGLLDFLNQQFNIKSNRLSTSRIKLSLNTPNS